MQCQRFMNDLCMPKCPTYHTSVPVSLLNFKSIQCIGCAKISKYSELASNRFMASKNVYHLHWFIDNSDAMRLMSLDRHRHNAHTNLHLHVVARGMSTVQRLLLAYHIHKRIA